MLENYHKAFKAYDIRAIYNKEIDIKFAYILGKAIGEYMNNTYGSNSRFLIGCDVREANIDIINHFLAGMKESDFDNVFFAKFTNDKVEDKTYHYGVCSTSTMYYLGQDQFDLGVSITASHNPGEYVGMKFFDSNVELIPTSELREMFDKHYFDGEHNIEVNSMAVGLIPEIENKFNKFISYLTSKWDKLGKKHGFVVDFSNGAGVTTEKMFFESIKEKHNISYINDKPDGNFSAHESDTSTPENYQQLSEKVKESWSDFGIMFDGDVDRVGFVTASGRVINCDIVTAIISKQVLKEYGEGKVLYDVMSTKSVADVSSQYKGEPIRTRMGRFFINRELNELNAIFAGEASGHYMFGEIGGYECPLLALYYVLKELENYENFDDMIKEFEKYSKSPITNVVVEDKENAIQIIKDKYADYKQDYMDGVSVYGDDFWFNVRPSNTEQKVRFTVETDNIDYTKKIISEIKQLIS